MQIIVDGKEVTREEYINCNDGRIISHYEVEYDQLTGLSKALHVSTAPSVVHLPHYLRV